MCVACGKSGRPNNSPQMMAPGFSLARQYGRLVHSHSAAISVPKYTKSMLLSESFEMLEALCCPSRIDHSETPPGKDREARFDPLPASNIR